LICINPSLGCRYNYEIPCGRGNLRSAEALPEFNIEIAVREPPADHARHDRPFWHLFHYAHFRWPTTRAEAAEADRVIVSEAAKMYPCA
jgi:hypothetical protein